MCVCVCVCVFVFACMCVCVCLCVSTRTSPGRERSLFNAVSDVLCQSGDSRSLTSLRSFAIVRHAVVRTLIVVITLHCTRLSEQCDKICSRDESVRWRKKRDS